MLSQSSQGYLGQDCNEYCSSTCEQVKIALSAIRMTDDLCKYPHGAPSKLKGTAHIIILDEEASQNRAYGTVHNLLLGEGDSSPPHLPQLF